MNAYLTLLTAIAPVFATIALGFAMRRVRWLTAEADQSLLRITVNVLYPCLAFGSILGNPALDNLGNVVLAPAVGFGTVTLGFAVAAAAARVFRLGDLKRRRAFAFATGLYNYGYIPLPLIAALFGHSDTAGVLFMHNLGIEICLWTVGIMVLTATSIREGWRKIFNPPVIAIVAAAALNFAGAKYWLPSFLVTTAHLTGAAAVPLGLILSGASFADLLRGAKLIGAWKIVAEASLLRLVVLPMLFLLLARYLQCSIELKRVIVVQAAMPSAIIPIVLTKHYGGDSATALQVVLGTTVVSLLTIPFAIRFGLWFVGIE
jgi:malate permease and related proteins